MGARDAEKDRMEDVETERQMEGGRDSGHYEQESRRNQEVGEIPLGTGFETEEEDRVKEAEGEEWRQTGGDTPVQVGGEVPGAQQMTPR